MTGSGHDEEELVVTAGSALSRRELAQRPGKGPASGDKLGGFRLHAVPPAASLQLSQASSHGVPQGLVS